MSLLVDSLKTAIANINTAMKNMATVVAGKTSINDSDASSTTQTYSTSKIETRLSELNTSLTTAINNKTQIDDTLASTSTVYSSSKVEAVAAAAQAAATASAADLVAAATTSYQAADAALATQITTAQTELQASIDDVAADLAAIINDTLSSTTTTYSSDKINSLITASATAVKAEILDGADAAYDTLKEIQTALAEDDTQIASILTQIGQNQATLAANLANLGAIADSAALDASVSKGFGYLAADVTFGTTGIVGSGSVLVLPYTAGGMVIQQVTTASGVVARLQTAVDPVWGDWMLVGGTVDAMQSYLSLGDTEFDFAAYWAELEAA